MNQTKTNEGITLVALVITIIVLIILAGVSINAVLNGGIITNAKEAKNQYNEGKQNELEALGILEEKMIEAQFTEEEKATAERLKNTKSEFESYFNENNLSYKYALVNKNQQAYLTGIEVGTTKGELNLPEGYILYGKDGSDTLANDTKVATGMAIVKNNEIVGRVVIFGDVNSSGTIDSADLTDFVYFFSERYEATEAEKIAMDINHDGKITDDDIQALVNYFSGRGSIQQDEYAQEITFIEDAEVRRKAFYEKIPDATKEKYSIEWNSEENVYVVKNVPSTTLAKDLVAEFKNSEGTPIVVGVPVGGTWSDWFEIPPEYELSICGDEYIPYIAINEYDTKFARIIMVSE